jgi:hypothetical protein
MSVCKGCGKEVTWVRMASGRRNPVEVWWDIEMANLILFKAQDGELEARVVEPGKGTHLSHFATCPKAEKFRVHARVKAVKR